MCASTPEIASRRVASTQFADHLVVSSTSPPAGQAPIALVGHLEGRDWLHDLEFGWKTANGQHMPGRGTAAVDRLRKTMQLLHEKRVGG